MQNRQTTCRFPAVYTTVTMLLATIMAAIIGCGRNRSVPYTEPSAPSPKVAQQISIVFGGDLMQHAPQILAAQRDSTYDYTDCFRYLKPFFDQADLVILNLETPLTTGPHKGYPLFSAPTQLASALRDSGADIIMTANNHACDKGQAGILSTLRTLNEAGLRHTGTFADSGSYIRNNPLYVEIKGRRFAFLNYTYGTNGLPVPRGAIVNRIDTARIAADLERIDRNETQYIIVYFHWGEEYARYPSRTQIELADWCHRHGVDFVIGSHPHVLQPVSARFGPDSTIRHITVYSLGNLVSNQRWRYSDGGAIVRIHITEQDSLPARYDPEYLLTWVHTPYVNGRKQYYILPSYVADTMLASDPTAQFAYERFKSDSRQLLADSAGFSEIKSIIP